MHMNCCQFSWRKLGETRRHRVEDRKPAEDPLGSRLHILNDSGISEPNYAGCVSPLMI